MIQYFYSTLKSCKGYRGAGKGYRGEWDVIPHSVLCHAFCRNLCLNLCWNCVMLFDTLCTVIATDWIHAERLKPGCTQGILTGRQLPPKVVEKREERTEEETEGDVGIKRQRERQQRGTAAVQRTSRVKFHTEHLQPGARHAETTSAEAGKEAAADT